MIEPVTFRSGEHRFECGEPEAVDAVELPSDIEPFLTWNLTHQRRYEMPNRAGPAAPLDGL